LPAAVVSLHPTSDGAFRLEEDSGWRVTASPGADRAVLSWEDGTVWSLEEDKSGAGGFVLYAGESNDSPVLGRTTRGTAASEGFSVVSLLLEDGSLFRIVVRGLPRPRIELLSWEVDGAYLVASPDEDVWRIRRTPAGMEWKAGREALVLFGAEILAQARHGG
jgi:hypothetical protein